MSKPILAVAVAFLIAGLAGCSQHGTTQLLNDSPSVQSASANPDLSMPPDLRLPPPGSGPVESQSALAAPAAPLKRTATAARAPVSPAVGAALPQGDIYEQNGISKVHSDGTPKTSDELRDELRKLLLAKKQQQNPNYGTVRNIGSIFKDG